MLGDTKCDEPWICKLSRTKTSDIACSQMKATVEVIEFRMCENNVSQAHSAGNVQKVIYSVRSFLRWVVKIRVVKCGISELVSGSKDGQGRALDFPRSVHNWRIGALPTARPLTITKKHACVFQVLGNKLHHMPCNHQAHSHCSR